MVPITSSISMENLDSRTLDEQETCLEQKRSRRLERLLPMRRLGEYLEDLSYCPLHVVVDDDVVEQLGGRRQLLLGDPQFRLDVFRGGVGALFQPTAQIVHRRWGDEDHQGVGD